MADHGVGEVEGGLVARWADFSPREADAWQPISALQPKLLPGAGSVPAVLSFDGVDDQLTLPEGFADFSAGLSAFIVASVSTDTVCQAFLELSNGGEMDDVHVGRSHGSVHYEVSSPSVWGPDNAMAVGERVLVGVVHAPNASPELRLNGAFMVNGEFTDLPLVTTRKYNFLGRSLYSACQPFQGTLGEVIVYSRALSSSERAGVQGYLQAKWTYEPPVISKPGPGEIPAAQ